MAAPIQSETLGALIRRYRLRAGLTQEGLAERAGISPRSVSDLERNVARAHYPHTLRRLGDALRLTEDEWLALQTLAGPDEEGNSAFIRPGPVRLPFLPTPFIGRESELSAVQALLAREDARLLTLWGPAGTGKTRLAVEAARRSSGAFP